jgi:PBP1b-binding outer membrane lipoprotein LpoB
MRKLIVMLMCCLLLTACAAPSVNNTTDPSNTPDQTTGTKPTQATQPEDLPDNTEEVTQPEIISFTLYTPNENVDGFIATQVEGEDLTPLSALIDAGVLNQEIAVNSVSLDGTNLAIDFNTAFGDLMRTQGTAGERMVMGCVVNTYLSAYDADTVTITVNGEILESGHVIYDFPMEFFN